MYLFIIAYLILLLSLFVYDEKFNVPPGEKIDYLTQVANGPPSLEDLENLTISGTMTCASLSIMSDRRIKKNIQPVSSSLELLRQLKPVKYQLKDSEDKEVYGFIAQEVKETMPDATKTQCRIIPTIYEEATCDKDILTFAHFQTRDLSYDEDKLFDKIKVDEEYVQILEVLDEHRIRVDKELPEKVFVLGQEVTDFLSIDSHQIFTVATRAVQELDTKVQRLEEENKSLLQRLIRLEERV